MAQGIKTAVLLAATAFSLSACSTYGDGYGYGYGASYGYYDDYDRGYYDRRAYPAYYGWYNDYYYPGTGYYVYRRSGDRYRWNDATRRYWEARRSHYRDRREWRENWSDYRREWRRDRRDDRREWRRERREDRREWRRDRRD